MKTTMKKETVSDEYSVRKRWFLTACFICLVCCSATALRAQTGTATLSGTVMDPNGRIVPGAEVSIANVDTNVTSTTKTNGDGIYLLTALQPGHYRVIVTKQGFKQIALTGVTLSTQDSVSRNFSLEVGAVSETVTVAGNAEGMPTDNPAVGLLVNRDFVENMPLNGRSLQDLIALAPGTTSYSGPNGGGLFAINGQRTDGNYYTVDGVGANTSAGNAVDGPGAEIAGVLPAQTALGTTQTLIGVDALQEFNIETSGFTAEYGRQPGGQVAFTSRSGSNDFHGSAFDYLRNNVLDANTYADNDFGIPRQPERQNDFGGTVGGPLEIPRIYDGKNRTFYFVSYEGLRLTQPITIVTSTPTNQFREAAAPSVQPFLNALPLPNGPNNNDACAPSIASCSGVFTGSAPIISSVDSLSLRVDQSIGRKVWLFGRYTNVPSTAADHSNPASLNTTNVSGHTWTLGSTISLRPNLVDELRFNYTLSTSSVTSTIVPFDGSVPYPRSLVIPPQYVTGAEPYFGFAGFFLPNLAELPAPGYGSQYHRQRQYNFIDSVSWAVGSHALKFGADYRRLLPTYAPVAYDASYYFLSFQGVQQGYADEAVVSDGLVARPVFDNLSLYAQDHWKLESRLTIDYGLRWEFNPAPGASDGIYPPALTAGSNVNSVTLATQGAPQFQTRYNDFAPRLGFAYQINSSQSYSVVVRGGGGIFYDTGQQLGAQGYSGWPFGAYNILTNLALPAPASEVAPPPFSVTFQPPYGSLTGVSDPHLKTPYTEQWNLSVDQQLGGQNTFTVSYVGNEGKRLLYQNYIFPTNPDFPEGILFVSNASSSSYNALQIQDHGFVAPGLQLIASYTWSHAIDLASTDTSSLYPPTRGNADFDVRNVFNLATNYSVPGATRDTLLRVLTKGWLLANRFSAQSGYPENIVQGYYSLPNGLYGVPITPDLMRGVPLYLHNVPGVPEGLELNPAAFSDVPTDPLTGVPVRQGTLPRNYVRGVGFWSWNTSIQRNFPIRDRLQMQFRVDAFNVLNHPNFGNPYNQLGTALFGQLVPQYLGVQTTGAANPLYGTGAARSLQFMLKLQF
jgi:Carboxypeptidase regulatory-like domain/TonB dependent receptor